MIYQIKKSGFNGGSGHMAVIMSQSSNYGAGNTPPLFASRNNGGVYSQAYKKRISDMILK